jgi:hypothetical protein
VLPVTFVSYLVCTENRQCRGQSPGCSGTLTFCIVTWW